MRLIDADKLMEDIIKICKCQPYLEGMQSEIVYIQDVVDEQPTAFDVDKVVEQLEKSHFHTDATFDDDGYCNDDSEEVVNLNEAIEIIRGGGTDENRNI